ncbi:MAG: diaminobutyrate--2-oxoglutarate transaminase [Pseudomonadota bacterium]
MKQNHTGLAKTYCLKETPLLTRQSQQESNARSYPRRIPLVLAKAQGIYVQDTKGQVYIDCLAGAGTLALGHNHPVTISAIQNALHAQLPLHTLDITTPIKDAFVQELMDCFPKAFSKNARIQFCGPSGADAVEAAIKLVRTATGKHSLLAFHGAYHGMTLGTLSVSGDLGSKSELGALVAGTQFLPYPNAFRCPFGLSGEASINASLSYIRNCLEDPYSGITHPAGMILETVQGEGGVLPAPSTWLQGIRELTKKHAIPLILDEIQCGIGRTGDMFAFEQSGILPDVITLSKAIGGGLPLSVVVYKDELDAWKPGAHAGTFRGNQLAMAAGTETLKFIKQNNLTENAQQMGQRFFKHLLELQSEFHWIGDVRGRGLMLGMEIIDVDNVPSHSTLGEQPLCDAHRASRFQRACLERGLIIELGGREGATARLLPPLIVTESEVNHILDIMFEAARAISQN